MYLWDLSGIQECVGNAGEQSTDIYRDDNGFILAGVGLSSCPRGGGSRGKGAGEGSGWNLKGEHPR